MTRAIAAVHLKKLKTISESLAAMRADWDEVDLCMVSDLEQIEDAVIKMRDALEEVYPGRSKKRAGGQP